MKKKIAVFANGWNGENLENFIDGMKESFPADSVDIFLFMSYAAYSVNEMGRKAENAIYFLYYLKFVVLPKVYNYYLNLPFFQNYLLHHQVRVTSLEKELIDL